MAPRPGRRREGWTFAEMVAWADGDVWTLLCLTRFIRLAATRRLDRLRHAARRPSYYGAENARRRARAAGRRIRRRTTLNPCPTREQILDAWLHVGEPSNANNSFKTTPDDGRSDDDDMTTEGARNGLQNECVPKDGAIGLRCG